MSRSVRRPAGVRATASRHPAGGAARTVERNSNGVGKRLQEGTGRGASEHAMSQRGATSVCGGSLLLLDRPLTLDAVPGEGQGLEPLLGNRLAAALAVPESPFVDLLQRGHDFLEQPPVAIAELEEKFAVVGRGGLIAQVLDRVVLRSLAVQDVLP